MEVYSHLPLALIPHFWLSSHGAVLFVLITQIGFGDSRDTFIRAQTYKAFSCSTHSSSVGRSRRRGGLEGTDLSTGSRGRQTSWFARKTNLVPAKRIVQRITERKTRRPLIGLIISPLQRRDDVQPVKLTVTGPIAFLPAGLLPGHVFSAPQRQVDVNLIELRVVVCIARLPHKKINHASRCRRRCPGSPWRRPRPAGTRSRG